MSLFSKLFGGNKNSTESLFKKGVLEYKKGNAEKAVELLSEAKDLEETKEAKDKQLLSNIFNIRGEVYLNQGVAVLSQSDFAQALEYNPNNENALNNLGIWFTIEMFSTPDYPKALEYLDKAISINPDRKDIILNRAIVKIQSGDKSGCDYLKELDKQGYADAKIGIERFCS